MNRLLFILVWFGLPGVILCQPFTPVNDSGIDHIFDHKTFIGGGVAWVDIDNDGDDDLYVTSGEAMDHLYINNGDGSFENTNFDAGLAITSIYYTTGVSFGDVNNDGYQDFFVCTQGSVYEQYTKNFLFINQQDGTFVDIWNEFASADLSYSIHANLFDFNNDNLLDIYVINYVKIASFLEDPITGAIIGYDHTCFANQLYENIDGTSFERLPSTAGHAGDGCSLASLATDIDHDLDLDLFVANDFGEFVSPNSAYLNQLPIDRFDNRASQFGLDSKIYGMGIAHADYDRDGDMDYYVTNFGENVLMERRDSTFVNVAIETNCDDTWIIQDSLLSISWGAIFADFDNDGYEDLYVANGYVPSLDFIPSKVNQNDKFFVNQAGTFVDETISAGIDNFDVSRGVSYSDYDQDGDLDMFVVNLNIPMGFEGVRSILYRNDHPNPGNFLQVDLEAIQTNRGGFGSLVEVHGGGQVLKKEKVNASSHCSQNSATLHFGLGELERVDSILVYWQGKEEVQALYDFDVNQKIKIIDDSILIDSMVLDTMTMDTMTMDTMTIDTMIVDTVAVFTTIKNNDVQIIPNPSSDCIYLEWKNPIDLQSIDVEIYNIIGEKQDIPTKGHPCIDISILPVGGYFLKVNLDQFTLTKKFLVAR